MQSKPTVSIEVDGEDKTAKIKDWTLHWSDRRGQLELTCHFPSGKTYTRPMDVCRISAIRKESAVLMSLKGSSLRRPVDTAVVYGEKYVALRYPGGTALVVRKLSDIELMPQSKMKAEAVFQHFMAVAAARVVAAEVDQRDIAKNIKRQLDAILPSTESALHAYCSGRVGQLRGSEGLIYPFGVNESQLQAVEQAFTSQISMIEGPPGTGKTQTILNIVANALIRGKTLAIVSNNNAAVANVYEKLAHAGLDHVVAQLGSNENQAKFFANLPQVPEPGSAVAPTMAAIQVNLARLKHLLRAHNDAARLRADIDELGIERRYLLEWRRESGLEQSPPLQHYRLSPRMTADLMAYLSCLSDKRVRLRDRLQLLLRFRIFRVSPFNSQQNRLSFFHALQLNYYDTALKEKEAALAACARVLESGRFDELLARLTSASMSYLKHHLHQRIESVQTFDQTNFKTHFESFLKRYPVIGSGTHSIVNSLAKGAMLDYIIIDEASQQDIVPGILALGCARNLVIVGDRKQLPHIPVTLGLSAPAPHYDCEKFSLLDSCAGLFKEQLPKTLLKEHYRCHPKIIQFCNQQFYENQLIPMTLDAGENALHLVTTAKGNHTRRNTNQRELDEIEALLAKVAGNGECAGLDKDGRGFIAPFRAQVSLSDKILPEGFVKDTVHKFQGRECSEIVFSTVLDKKRESQNRLNFVDNPHMINVAVSRAKHRFVLTTGDKVFAKGNGHIAALVRYMDYYAGPDQVTRASVVSAFDLLYTEYDESLERLAAKLRPQDSFYKSEQIVAQLLREVLSATSFSALKVHSQIKLNQLASPASDLLTNRERSFINNRASCDFVIYFRLGKTPLGVIEVDGGMHDEPEQMMRDALKNSILEKVGLPLLRLRTVQGLIKERIAAFLASWADGVAKEQGND